MKDLEIVQLCAAAMGYEVVRRTGRKEHGWWAVEMCKHYDPLHDDAQAMALVKKFRMGIDIASNMTSDSDVHGASLVVNGKMLFATSDVSLNNAICSCVATMQQSKERNNVKTT